MDWRAFSFDYRLVSENLTAQLIEIEANRKAVTTLLLPPEWKQQLDRLNRVRTIHGTTALEGNPLSEDQVAEYLERVDEHPASTKEKLQIDNASAAQEWVRSRFHRGAPPIKLLDILHMHLLMTQHSDEQDNVPGRLRTHGVQAGTEELGGVHICAPHEDVPRLMDDFVGFVNSRQLRSQHPVVRALVAHFFLVTIHPFGDGNGRVSRLIEAAILYQGDYNVHGFYGLSNYFYRNGDDYKRRLQACRGVQPFDLTPFVDFGLIGFDAELKGINNFIKKKLNRLVYRDMMNRAIGQKLSQRRRLLNHREYALVSFLLDETEPTDPFSAEPSRRMRVADLVQSAYFAGTYHGVTQRTFRRELIRLADLGFISFVRQPNSGDYTVDIDFSAIGKY